MFPPQELQAAEGDPGRFARQVAFAALQCALDEALSRLEERSFDQPTASDPVFLRCPSLLGRVTKDGLVQLTAEDVADEQLRAEGVLAVDGAAVYVHPMLASARELVAELVELAAAE